MICLIVSVERTVEIPIRLPSKEAKVDFPVPDVPAKSIIIFLLDSIKKNEIEISSYKQDLRRYKNLSRIQVLSTYTSLNAYLVYT